MVLTENAPSAARSAVKVLAAAGVRSLPVDPTELARHFGVKMVDYSTFSRTYGIPIVELYAHSKYGFGFYEGDGYVCAVNENACGGIRRRWTAAHELGHYFLGHISEDRRAERSADAERQADAFAAELLAPLLVLHFCAVSSAEELARLCLISQTAARIRFEELCGSRRAAAKALHQNGFSGALSLDSPENMALLSGFAPFTAREQLKKYNAT